MRLTTYTTEQNEDDRTELVKERAINYRPGENITMNNPDDVVEMMTSCFNLDRKSEEYVYMVAVNTKLHPVGVFEISHGTVNQSLVTPREVYTRALLCGAVSIFLIHNHPSEEATPSQEDFNATKRIAEAGELLGVPLLDHIIIGGRTYCSLKRYSPESFK